MQEGGGVQLDCKPWIGGMLSSASWWWMKRLIGLFIGIIFINAFKKTRQRGLQFDASPRPMLGCHQAGDSSDELLYIVCII